MNNKFLLIFFFCLKKHSRKYANNCDLGNYYATVIDERLLRTLNLEY